MGGGCFSWNVRLLKGTLERDEGENVKSRAVCQSWECLNRAPTRQSRPKHPLEHLELLTAKESAASRVWGGIFGEGNSEVSTEKSDSQKSHPTGPGFPEKLFKGRLKKDENQVEP